MTTTRTADYGTWRSPITAQAIVTGTVGVDSPHHAGGTIYWLESRPQEGGRSVLMRLTPQGERHEVAPPAYDVRSRVHEYGGAAYTVAEHALFFVNFTDQRIHHQAPNARPRPMTPRGPWRYADIADDPTHARILCVREDHGPVRRGTAREPVNEIVALPYAGAGASPGQALVSGRDFVSSPRVSPDGRRLAWLAWDHPDMPWDAAELWLAEFDQAGDLQAARRIAGGPGESVLQPGFAADGALHFVSDRTGWWNLYRREGDDSVALAPAESDFGAPQWVFGMTTYAILGDGRIVATASRDGLWRLGTVESGAFHPLDLPFTAFASLAPAGNAVLAVAASADRAPALIRVDPATGAWETLASSMATPPPAAYLSAPEPMTYASTGGASAHAFFYAPHNPDFRAPDGARPPLIVRSHGGPTGAASSALNLSIQFWTSRGFAVLDVNYRGSSGYGRAYRDALRGRWGVHDVDDCAMAARAVAGAGLADPARLIIRGGSAGGYTTLAALTFRDVFTAGASLYGVGDLTALATETHKFESHYLDRLIGPLPEAEALYRARSPVRFPERLSCPVIFLQGLEDRVVPPNQAERMVAALKDRGVPVAYLAFPGEGHGFRRAENVRRALEAELYFYGRVFGFEPADTLEPVEIFNLPG